ncbi:conserved hypothetical protein [Talaromyces stipitatus ATCC 10500]|uniref:Uncharacterized protein n=1 Tax=Talaromyces stipitatus (strain ATCC 10500 / CBS 375.48 / QM 6759 / NRRL 1006) TaxID=441959 RepID=B8LU59_TALSN|nr:uncharacterized protein TSTA_060280 [Talaromyces stipitatus ATCC 10500]EED22531.1 conserved hypothetical protein [Talaromyces stipitatus ATCC 10500]
MEKCWFTLAQNHYPPSTPTQKGPIQLGHLLSSLIPLPPPINTASGPLPLPAYMPIYPSRLTDLRWQSATSSTLSASATAQLPIPQAMGLVSAGGGAGIAFQKSIARFWCFDAVDVEIIQPDEEYIEESLEVECVKAWIERKRKKSLIGAWSMFMITGLAIARGVRGDKDSGMVEGKGWGIELGPQVSLPSIVDVGISGGVGRTGGQEMTFSGCSDFVWAIQVMRISKRFMSSGWSFEPYVKGATYAVEEEEDIEKMLAGEGVPFESIHRDGDDIFVVTSQKDQEIVED